MAPKDMLLRILEGIDDPFQGSGGGQFSLWQLNCDGCAFVFTSAVCPDLSTMQIDNSTGNT